MASTMRNGTGASQSMGQSTRQFPHLRDIIAKSVPTISATASLKEQLAECEKCATTAKNSMNYGRPDMAFRNYLTATHILTTIQRDKQFGFWSDNNKAWSDRYKLVRNILAKIDPQMDAAKQAIEDNNARYGTVQHFASVSVPKVIESTSPPSPSQDRPTTSDLPESLTVGRPHPPPAPKPDGLKGQPLAGANDMHARFARLRLSNQPISTSQNADFQNGMLPIKPQGPRDMPPPIPMKVPILMPKPPSPTYSPVSINNDMAGKRPPVERSQTYYNQPLSPVAPNHLAKLREDNPYRPKTPNGINTVLVTKSKSSEIPHHTMVDAETLASYIKKYNVLLVDIRDRTQFDEGHIFANSIICVEPVSLKEGVSAEELEERLILSPEVELSYFSRRNEFDLVVYYDQSTSSDSYLKGPPTHNSTPHLRAFYDTLHEFNDYKRLKDGRPPALLQGGIDAWVDIMSPQSLVVSKTAATLGTTRQRVQALSRPSGQQRVASHNSRYAIRNRRLRDHKFLDENEQAAWRQKAEQEQVTTDNGQNGQMSDGELEDHEPPSPFVSDYEAFFRRFPTVEQQSMTMAQPRRAPPPIPIFEALPEIPTRPAPAIPRPSYHGQSEIIQAQAPLARVSSSTKQPLYSSAMATQTRKVPRTGLVNFGVTCYMNSVLQCLSATVQLAQFFMDESSYRANVQKNWKGSSGIMPDLFATVIRSLWKGDVQVIKPSTFRNFCGRMKAEWVTDRQQDAKEFLEFLVDCLHEDLNLHWQRSQLRPLTEAEEMNREKLPITQAAPIEWSRYEHREFSFMSSLFAGQHASRLRCLTCNNTSTTYEPFYAISVEIPKEGVGDIYQCLRSYTQEEKLSDSEQWTCSHCKCKRQATKQIILTRLPDHLVIHFKRFSMVNGEKARKIHTPIGFPLQGLEMDPFVVPGNPIPNGAGPSETNRRVQAATTPPFNYDAYAVLRHLGSSGDGGHYISMVKDPGRNCWRKFDDQQHYDFDPSRLSSRDRLQNQEAYIVFFQRAHGR